MRWNTLSLNFPLSVSDLTPTVKPSLLMGALMEILCAKLGIDREAIVAPPREEDRDEHTEYYWDLLPVINMTRVVNYVLSTAANDLTITMMDLLNPSPRSAQMILALLANLASFYVQRRESIEPREKELFANRDQVTALEEERNQLLELLNEQAAEKASRAIRLQKLEEDKKVRDEELRSERLHREDELRELQQVLGEDEKLRAALDKRRAQQEVLAAEAARARSQRVTDADDVRAQHEQAARGERDATARLDALKQVLLEKEASVRTLQAASARLADGILYVHEIAKLTDTLKEATLSSGKQQAEIEAALSEGESGLREIETQLAEAQRERRELHEERQREAAAAKLAVSAAQSAEGAWRRDAERAERAAERTSELRARTEGYVHEKQQQEDKLTHIVDQFFSELKSFEEVILKECKMSDKILENKLEHLTGS